MTRGVARCVMAPNRGGRASAQRCRCGSCAVVGSGVLVAGVLGYLGLVDPHYRSSGYPLCPFKLITGWNCPACGGLRMVHDLLHGNLMAGVHDNVFLLVGLPLLAGWALLRHRQGKSWLPLPAMLMIGVAAIGWTVLRNLPGFPWGPTIS